MSEDNVQRIVRKYGKLAKEQDNTIPEVHPHMPRHSYGAQLYRLGASLPEIAKLMGHSEIRTTEIYLLLSVLLFLLDETESCHYKSMFISYLSSIST